MTKGAHFSDDRLYRYALWRIWNEYKPLVMFIGLNPSKAHESKDDPTIRRVTRFAYDWGYGGFYMMNLFAFVTPYPRELQQCADPLGDNDHWLDDISLKCEMIVFVWGAFKAAKVRSQQVEKRFPGAYCIGTNKDGSPGHPLFLPGILKPKPYASILL
jgi:hypothetical protein